MIKIRVKDTATVLAGYRLPRNIKNSMAKALQQRILAETYTRIVGHANRSLNTSKKAYIDGLRMYRYKIELEGWLPNAIENGIGPFDIKQGFSTSNKRKLKKKTGGWYLTIPMRVFTPGRGNYNNSMSWQIYRAVRAGKKYNPGSPTERSAFGDAATGKIFEMYQHKAPILQGIQENKNQSTGRSTYNTFRRVSDKSDSNSWIHTGILAHNLFDKAWADVDVDEIIDETLGNL